MTFRKLLPRILAPALIAGVFCAAWPVFGQSGTSSTPLPDPSYGVFNFNTKIGSFKLLDGEGKVEVSFTGTLLVSQLKGSIVPSGQLRKEYSSRDKEAWHGSGKVVINGSFRAVQWFGTNMNGRWVGKGRIRVYGEFDQNLKTGSYWYGDAPKEVQPWSTYGIELAMPAFTQGGSGTPVERKPGGGRSGG